MPARGRFAFLLLGFFSVTMLGRAQDTCERYLSAWVHPTHGNDSTAQFGDPNLPFKKLQTAIDAAHLSLAQHFVPGPFPPAEPETFPTQAIIYAMPGLYGPHGTSISSSDTLPIAMRDRVHVQGVGARRCVIRADTVGSTTNPPTVLVPCSSSATPASTGVPFGPVVLVDFQHASKYSPYFLPSNPNPLALPWMNHPEAPEVFDGFTLQGGKVQVSFANQALGVAQSNPKPLQGRVSNCLFDMRHQLSTETGTLCGPSVGVLVSPHFFNGGGTGAGYFEIKAHILNNTFIMYDAISQLQARDQAIGILDVCNWGPLSAIHVDPIATFRGISPIGVQNNIFRTPPDFAAWATTGAPQVAAMVGVSGVSTTVRNFGSTDAYVQTNAFAPLRANTYVWTMVDPGTDPCNPWNWACGNQPPLTQHWISSVPEVSAPAGFFTFGGAGTTEPLFQTTGVAAVLPAPRPAITLFNGANPPPAGAAQEYDPVFVGETMAFVLPNPPYAGYRDYRLVPGSPMVDQGRLYRFNEIANGTVFGESACPDIKMADYDGEGYGNRRVIRQPDVGFDEANVFIMCGNYANHDNSHNLPPRNGTTPIFNAAVGTGQQLRYVMIPNLLPGSGPAGPSFAGSQMKFWAVEQTPTSAPEWSKAWTQPPGTLASAIYDANKETFFQLQYINFNNNPPYVSNPGWQQDVAALANFHTRTFGTTTPSFTNQPDVKFYLIEPLADDSEGATAGSWFNSQIELLMAGNGPELMSNLQAEYR